jgi:hypothetical protein
VPLQPPSDWVSLNVARDLGIRGSYPQVLGIKRQAKSKNLYAQWLPTPEDDPRPNQGRARGGKRLTWSQSMGTDDPYEAGKLAIAWVQTKQRELREQKEEISAQSENALSRYWERWFAREQRPAEWGCSSGCTPVIIESPPQQHGADSFTP